MAHYFVFQFLDCVEVDMEMIEIADDFLLRQPSSVTANQAARWVVDHMRSSFPAHAGISQSLNGQSGINLFQQLPKICKQTFQTF